MSNAPDEIAALKQALAQARQENHALQQQLAQQQRHTARLIQWLQALHRDINDVYHSATWKMGESLTHWILWLLGRKAGVTARDHVNRLWQSFELWLTDYRHTTTHKMHVMAWHETTEYQQWIQQFDTLNAAQIAKIHAQIQHWQTPPNLTIFCFFTEKTDAVLLKKTLDSLIAQYYPHWQCWVIVAQNTEFELVKDERIHWVIQNAPREKILNTQLKENKSDFFSIIQAGDLLPAHALFKIAQCSIEKPNTQLIYTDEDKLNTQEQRYSPYFKSEWNLDLFYAQHYLKHLTFFKTATALTLNGLQHYPHFEDYDLALRFIETIDEKTIQHIAHILYHHRADIDDNPFVTSVEVLNAHFQRLQSAATVEKMIAGHTRIHHPLPAQLPKVSVIIPTRNRYHLLKTTVEGILKETDYSNLELIIVDNGSDEIEILKYFEYLKQNNSAKIIHHSKPFNYSELNNLAVEHASGEILAFLNNDLKIIHADWLKEMLSHALRPQIGAVGAKLYYANDTLQHAGVILGLGGLAGHALKNVPREAQSYQWKAFLTQNYSAVTAACLMMRKAVFKEIKGFDAKDLKVAFNDVDLCLKLRKQGYKIVWTPHAQLYHLESISRGVDNTPAKYLRLRHELTTMQQRWQAELQQDSYYNPNLTIQYEDYSLAYPPRIQII